jgi:hypothetical protein
MNETELFVSTVQQEGGAKLRGPTGHLGESRPCMAHIGKFTKVTAKPNTYSYLSFYIEFATRL